jgi:type VI secretion system protein ImpM
MPKPSPPPEAPGFFGKVPALGDFLSRRVPAGLRDDWEAWLADLVVSARAALGDDWPKDWLTAPLWHFVLGNEILPPDGAAGVLIASADRVGRMFPFTVIGAAGAAGSTAASLADWSGQAEALALDALEDDLDTEAFDAALRKLGPPPAVSGARRTTGHWHLLFRGNDPIAGDNQDVDGMLQPPGADQSSWWCRGSDRVAPMHLRCLGLPDAETAAAMITGNFRWDGQSPVS